MHDFYYYYDNDNDNDKNDDDDDDYKNGANYDDNGGGQAIQN